ncbi:MAG TPA: alkaline phosphatase family protein [Bryobacteraceae bacterium]|nr:alkaline phosphatase family protein [Bryobacteraceae bacterium]
MRLLLTFAAAVLLCRAAAGAPRDTRNVILITADGLRWQELFGGMDPLLKDAKSAGMQGEDTAALRDRLWRSSPEERRQALMPFFWKTLAPHGVVLGNLTKGSSMRVTNAFRVSYPGYSEILTGRAQDGAIRGNDAIRNPVPTVLEFVRKKLGLNASQVALFGSWDMFQLIGEHTPGSVFINSGYRALDPEPASPRLRELNAMQFDVLTPWPSARHDYITFEMALEYLKTQRPRFLYIALDETDDWAHDHRYDRVLDVIGYLDRCLRKLWDAVEDSPDYRGHTMLVITCDHGRGSSLENWHSHGKDVPEAAQIWAAFIGPDTPTTGQAANVPEVFQRDITPTILDLLGLDYRDYEGVMGKPIAIAIREKAATP